MIFGQHLPGIGNKVQLHDKNAQKTLENLCNKNTGKSVTEKERRQYNGLIV